MNSRAADLMNEQQSSWLKLRKLLSKQGIEVVGQDGLRDTDHKWLTAFFTEQIYSVLTPVAIDPAHPFPFIPNFGFTIAVMMERKDGSDPMFGLISIPQDYPVSLGYPDTNSATSPWKQSFPCFWTGFFRGSRFLLGVFKSSATARIEIEEEAEDLVLFYEAAIRKRRRGSVIRLTLDSSLPGRCANS